MTRPPRFRLVVTLGPASLDRAADLVGAGATEFRLNASHLAGAALESALATARAAAPTLPIVVDLQGAKMRLGDFPPRPVAAGDRVVFVLGAAAEDGALPLPHPELFAAARPGATLSCHDGKLPLRVLEAAPDRLVATVRKAGVLRPRKGVNLGEHPVALAGLTLADQRAVASAQRTAGVRFACSFVTDGRELDWVRALAPGRPVAAKIERAEAVQALAALARQADETWICRGDLGAQLGLPALARFVGGLDPRGLPSPVLMAGQVFEHLTRHAEPTRSEVCHFHDLAARGYAGVVLSDETAVGSDPVRAVARVAELARAFGG